MYVRIRVPARPYAPNEHAVGDAEPEGCQVPDELLQRLFGEPNTVDKRSPSNSTEAYPLRAALVDRLERQAAAGSYEQGTFPVVHSVAERHFFCRLLEI